MRTTHDKTPNHRKPQSHMPYTGPSPSRIAANQHINLSAQLYNPRSYRLLFNYLRLQDHSARAPLSYATMKGREGIVEELSNSRTPNCESMRNQDPMTTPVTDKNTSDQQVTHLPRVIEPATLPTAHDPRKKGEGGSARQIEEE